MKRALKIVLLFFILFFLGVYLNNTSLLVPSGNEKPLLLAHRGIHQTYDKTGIDDKTCTAQIIYQPTHKYLENTLPSIQAAFKAGADMVEIDIHPTTDGHFAVFHDWTLDCRTEGKGVTRTHSLTYLKTLDIGYGYTADQGKTYPFRGQAIGLIPSLKEVLEQFPNRSFLINFKSKDPSEADRLAEKLKHFSPEQLQKIMVYGGAAPTNKFTTLMPDVRGFTKSGVKKCLINYILKGWSGYIPDTCRNTGLVIPQNYAPWLWGWPDRFIARMKSVNTTVFIAGGVNKAGSFGGVDTLEQLKQLPSGYSGGIWTNRIEIISKHLSKN